MLQVHPSPQGQGPQHELMSVLLAASPDEFEALMQQYFPTELDSELEELHITAPFGGILREAAATGDHLHVIARANTSTWGGLEGSCKMSPFMRTAINT
eukprot:115885-Pelagomonas_calceolata.AAC.1